MSLKNHLRQHGFVYTRANGSKVSVVSNGQHGGANHNSLPEDDWRFEVRKNGEFVFRYSSISKAISKYRSIVKSLKEGQDVDSTVTC